MYKEVEIKTPLELAKYLVNEGDLYTGDRSRLYAEDVGDGESPFRVEYVDGDKDSLKGLWRTSDETYYKKLEWYECIPKGKKVPCYVSDICQHPDKSCPLQLVVGHDPAHEIPFITSGGHCYIYATPIPAKELWMPES